MAKNLKLFSTENDFANALSAGVDIPQVAYVSETDKSYCIPTNAWGISTPSDSSVALTMKGSATAWNNYKAKIGRYLVKENGEAYKLNPNNSTQLQDGTTFDVGSGNVMVRIPRLYFLSVTGSNGSTTLWMSEEPFCENVIEEQWVGAYLGYVTGGKLVSRRGVNPTRSLTINQFFNYAQGNGSAWGLADYTQRRLMMMLYLSQYLNLNSQAMLGNGMTGDSGNWTSQVQSAVTGDTYSLGDSCGKVAYTTTGTNANHVSLFGIEDPYGWLWEMIQGCYFIGNYAYVYSGNRMPDSAELSSAPKTPYRRLDRVTSSGWVARLIGGAEFDVMPKTLGGGSASYMCDYHYANNTGQLLLWGGPAYDGSNCGLSYSDSNDVWSYAYSSRGSRLAYYGKVTIR